MTLYHYTSKESYNAIKEDEKFYPTYFREDLDAAYGEGWYFTDLPTSTDIEILEKTLWTTNGSNSTIYK